MELCINGEQLRRAVSAISAAEANGFNFCLAVFTLTNCGPMLSSCRAKYSDLCEMAHPTDGSLDWGRFQGVTRRNRFINGELVPIVDNAEHAAVVKKSAHNKRSLKRAKPRIKQVR